MRWVYQMSTKIIDCIYEGGIFRPLVNSAWSNKGYALDELGRTEEALLAFENATRLDPNYALAWHNKG